MTDTVTETTGTDELLSELRAWLDNNWDPDLTVAEWWERLGLAGWSAPGLPTNAYGKGMARSDTVLVQQEIANFGALGAPAGLGLLLAAPTIATHGTQEQIDLYVRDIVTGQKAWCQLFSEPQAGSDLAGLQTRAIKDGDEWIVNGQKVWTSGGQYADLGMLLARTDPDVPKHQGISYFAFNMLQDGVDVRPLKEMTGHALFNEVFLTDARVADSALIGGLNNGWAVANTTLANERAGLGSGGGNAAGGGLAQPGTVMGMLARRVGDLVAPQALGERQEEVAGAGRRAGRHARRRRDAHRPRPVRGHEQRRRHPPGPGPALHARRDRPFQRPAPQGGQGEGGDIPGMPNVSKLSMSQIVRLTRDLGLRILGPGGHAPRLRRRLQGRAEARDRATPSPVASRRWHCSRRRRRSTAARTRSSATSSASASWACPKSPTTTG